MEINYCLKCMEKIESYPCPKCGFDGNITLKSTYQLAPGRILDGKYLVGNVIGHGGFGITYLGYNLVLNNKIAIKEYYPKAFADRDGTKSAEVTWSMEQGIEEQKEKGINSVIEEARKMAKVEKIDAVVRVQDAFQANNTAYIIMEYVEGETLKQYLFNNGPMRWSEIKEKLYPVIDALEKVHNNGIVHRDISPDNIMLLPNGNIKLLDLGAAKDISQFEGQRSEQVIKAGFSPFEQYAAKGESAPCTDVYALAATIIYSITGKLPPSAPDRIQGIDLDWEDPLLKAIPENAVAALKKAMATQKADRIQSMAEFKDALEGKINLIEEPEQKKKGKIIPIALLAVAALGLAVFAFFKFSATGVYTDMRDGNYYYTEKIKGKVIDSYVRNYENRIKAQEYLDAGDYENAFQAYYEAANKGDCFCAEMVANMYENGKGVAKNADEAKNWHALARFSGDAVSLCTIAEYYNEKGMSADSNKWAKLATEKGEPRGFVISAFYSKDTEAEPLYTKAYENALTLLEEYNTEPNKSDPDNYKDYCKETAGLAASGLGMIAEGKKDGENAAKWYKTGAELGNGDSIYNLANVYFNGEYADQDIYLAIDYYTKAGELGNKDAYNILGAIYNSGEYVEQDADLAITNYFKAAELGDDSALFNLACIYDEEQDTDMAIEYYIKAAELGNSSALLNLGVLYENSNQDFDKAIEYYTKAAEQGNSDVMFNLGVLYENAKQDYDSAIEYYTKAAEAGNSSALFNLGNLYENVKQDMSQAIDYYIKAVDLGNADALEYLKKMATESDNSAAYYNLGNIYYNGEAVSQDVKLAMEYYIKAAELDNSNALYKLGGLYYNGSNVETDIDKAIEYYTRAGGLGHSGALAKLGNIYYDGKYVEKDVELAVEYFIKADEFGDSTAVELLKRLADDVHYFNPVLSRKYKYSNSDTTMKETEVYAMSAVNLNDVSTRNVPLRLPERDQWLDTPKEMYIRAMSGSSAYLQPEPGEMHGNLGTIAHGSKVWIIAQQQSRMFIITSDNRVGWCTQKLLSETKPQL